MPATLPFILLSRCCGDEHPPELMLQPLRVPTAQGKGEATAHHPDVASAPRPAPCRMETTTREDVDVGTTAHKDRDESRRKHSTELCCHPSHEHPSPVCAQAAGAVLSTAHSPAPELTGVPSLRVSSGLPCSRACHVPHCSDPPNSSRRQRLPGCCRQWGFLALVWCLWHSVHTFKGN